MPQLRSRHRTVSAVTNVAALKTTGSMITNLAGGKDCGDGLLNRSSCPDVWVAKEYQ